MWYVSFATWGAMTMVNSNVPQIYRAVVGPANFETTRNAVFVSLFGTGTDRCWTREAAYGCTRQGGLVAVPVLAVGDGPLTAPLPDPPRSGAGPTVLPDRTGNRYHVGRLSVDHQTAVRGRAPLQLPYTAGMVTPLFFNLWLFSSVYESHSRKQHQPKLSECDGVACIGLSIGIATMMNVFAIPVAFLFAWRMDKGTLFM
jgi:hypothetical protein